MSKKDKYSGSLLGVPLPATKSKAMTEEVVEESPAEEVSSKKIKKSRWFFATNTENIKSFIAQGLITSPEGIADDGYYKDTLEAHNGCIPVFRNLVPIDIVNKSLLEGNNMKACIIELDLHLIKGEIYIEIEDEIKKIGIEEVLKGDCKAAYIPSPIPISVVQKIIFNDSNDSKKFKNESGATKNILLHDLSLSSTVTDRKLFNNKHEYTIPKDIMSIRHEAINYPKIYAFGGILALLFYFTKNGKFSNEVYKSFAHLTRPPENSNNTLNLFFKSFDFDNQKVEGKTTFIDDLVTIIIKSKATNFKQDILTRFHKLDSDSNEGTPAKEKASHTIDSLEEVLGMSNRTNSERFEQSTTSVERALIALFMLDNSDDMIDFKLNQHQLSEEDYFIFCMLFGAKDKFIEISKYLKEFKHLLGFSTTQMANYAHKTRNSDLSFISPNKEPKTLGDMFDNSLFKQKIATKYKIECLTTIVKIPKGEYKTKISATGLEFIFDGLVKNTSVEINNDIFFKEIIKLDFKDYNNLLKLYEKK